LIGGCFDDDVKGSISSDHEIKLISTGNCVHYNREMMYGFGQLRNTARTNIIVETKREMFLHNDLASGSTAMYHFNLKTRPPSGNCQQQGTSKAVVDKAHQESRDHRLHKNLQLALALMLEKEQEKTPGERYLRSVTNTIETTTVACFLDQQIEMFRRGILRGSSCFIDATGGLIDPIHHCYGVEPKPVFLTSVQISSLGPFTREAMPLRVATFVGQDARAENLVVMWRSFRTREKELYGNNVQSAYWGMDCGLNLLLMLLLVENETDYENYRNALWEAAMNPSLDLETEVFKRGWSFMTWCLYHVRRAWYDYAKKELTATKHLKKAEVASALVSLMDYVRTAPTPQLLLERKDDVKAILGEQYLKTAYDKLIFKALLSLKSGVVGLHTGSSVDVLQVNLPTFVPTFETTPMDVENPFFNGDTFDYVTKASGWFYRDVLWTEAFVGGRTKRCDATSETTYNILKNVFLRNQHGTTRLDVFVAKDSLHVEGCTYRLVDEEKKWLASGGEKMSAAVR
jgi:hypothetical protein